MNQMAKWADYLISQASYDSNHHLSKIRHHKDSGVVIDDGQIITRDALIENLKNGIEYVTIFSSNSTWKLGDKVFLVKAGNEFFIRTDSNKVEADNLKFVSELK